MGFSGKVRLGLCCKFDAEEIRFRVTSATHALRLSPSERLAKLSGLCVNNAVALRKALEFCVSHGIGAFRINSQILPLRTHPEAGYKVAELPDGDDIRRRLKACGRLARQSGLRLSFHPDQFILLSSVREDVTARSIEELEYQAEVAQWVGADVINIHGGGGYGDKPAALRRVADRIRSLKPAVRSRLTLENDERVYAPRDLLDVCGDTGVPLVYDVHHHRCYPDGLSEAEATRLAIATWDREPLMHISSSANAGGDGPPGPHSDFIPVEDVPTDWRGLEVTVDVEAKAKERAVLRLARDLRKDGWWLWPGAKEDTG